MAADAVRAYLAGLGMGHAWVDRTRSTVAEAADTLGVTAGQIAKTLAVSWDGGAMLIVCAGDMRLSNPKCKATFGKKLRMLGGDDALALIGHPPGGVCPFALKHPWPVYLDESLRAYEIVYPAAGSCTSSVKLTPAQLAEWSGGTWVDVCRSPQDEIHAAT